MIRIEGVPVVAERLRQAACQAGPRQGAVDAAKAARDEFQTGVDMDPGAILQGSGDRFPNLIA